MEYTIDHRTTYFYADRVSESYTVVHLQPRSDPGQYCMRYELHIEPRVRLFSFADRFANDVQHFSILPDHQSLTVHASSHVVTAREHDPAPPDRVTAEDLAADPLTPTLYDFLAPSPHVAITEAVATLAGEIGDPNDPDLAAWFLRAGSFFKRAFAYDRDATTVQTTVDEAIRTRAGVCQDYAHVLLALCRMRGLPARYVSGYVFSGSAPAESADNRILGADASHAWVEAYLPPFGWVGFDPTNDKLVNDEFVKVAVGTDYRDVSPVRGVYKGASKSMMAVNVAVEALLTPQQQQQQQQ
jgi:transglutaminase-like putative cysteine protease